MTRASGRVGENCTQVRATRCRQLIHALPPPCRMISLVRHGERLRPREPQDRLHRAEAEERDAREAALVPSDVDLRLHERRQLRHRTRRRAPWPFAPKETW